MAASLLDDIGLIWLQDVCFAVTRIFDPVSRARISTEEHPPNLRFSLHLVNLSCQSQTVTVAGTGAWRLALLWNPCLLSTSSVYYISI